MDDETVTTACYGLSRIKLFFALSRTPHGLLDMTTPAFAALLWLGSFPSLYVIILGIITTFSGYTAVYALNDVVDYRADKEKFEQGGFQDSNNYLDGVMVRHPMAQGVIRFREGLVWAIGWGSLALVGAAILNPVCALIFLTGAALETMYCLMWRISPFRTVVSGAVKTSGAMAAIFAVDPSPSAFFLLMLFFCLFFWEVGGQNIPADWTDIEEDRKLSAQTIPVRFGLERANLIIMGSIILSLILTGALFFATPVRFQPPFIVAAVFFGCYLLLIPAIKLFKSRSRQDAMALFNKASHYPAVLLIVVAIKSIL